MSGAVSVLKAMADPTRLRIAAVLGAHELSVNEVAGVLAVGQSRVSRHLAILSASALVQARRDGLSVYYRLCAQGSAAVLVEAVRGLVADDEATKSVVEGDFARAAATVADRGARSRQFFDSRAAEWDGLARELLGDTDLGAEVLRLLAEARAVPEVALDIGCGTGALLGPLRESARRVIGVDSSPRMLERARRRFRDGEGVELRLGEAEHLPLGDGEADLAVMSMTLHHLAEPRAGLREVARVTGAEGAFLLVELARHEREELREEQGDRWLGFGREELVAMAGDAGFSAVSERGLELPRGLGLGLYLFRKTTGNGGTRDGQREDL